MSNNLKDQDVDYAIYPSLLDAYLRFKRTDDEETFSALFDKINGVKSEQTEQQLKGVLFEQCINDLIDGKDIQLSDDAKSFKCGPFAFKIDLMYKIASKLRKCRMKQNYIECIINTKVGKIKLYGIADYRFDDMLVDLKTTASYKVNKYTDSKDIKYTQHLMYPLIKKHLGTPISAFKYVASDFENDFQETFIPTENMEHKLMAIIYEFIVFINHFKVNITDMKVFGGRDVNHAA